MNIREILPSLTNEKKRRDFIAKTYREWDPCGTVSELQLEFFRLTLPDGRSFVAMEYPMQVRWKPGGRGVVYFDVPEGNSFSYLTISENQAASELMVYRNRLLAKEVTP
jgi:hypothetical protein